MAALDPPPRRVRQRSDTPISTRCADAASTDPRTFLPAARREIARPQVPGDRASWRPIRRRRQTPDHRLPAARRPSVRRGHDAAARCRTIAKLTRSSPGSRPSYARKPRISAGDRFLPSGRPRSEPPVWRRRRYGAWQALSRGPSVVLAELILTGCDFESERSNTATGANSRRAWARKLIPFATAAPCWPLRGRDSTQAPRSCGPTTMLASRRPGSCSRTAPPISGTARPPANAQKLRRLLSSYHG